MQKGFGKYEDSKWAKIRKSNGQIIHSIRGSDGAVVPFYPHPNFTKINVVKYCSDA
jgi:hypothetical protein